MPRRANRQVVNLYIRSAIFNRFAALGAPLPQRAGSVCLEQGSIRPKPDLRSKAGQELSVSM